MGWVRREPPNPMRDSWLSKEPLASEETPFFYSPLPPHIFVWAPLALEVTVLTLIAGGFPSSFGLRSIWVFAKKKKISSNSSWTRSNLGRKLRIHFWRQYFCMKAFCIRVDIVWGFDSVLGVASTLKWANPLMEAIKRVIEAAARMKAQ